MTDTPLVWIKQKGKGNGRNQFFRTLLEPIYLNELLFKTLSFRVPCAMPCWPPSVQQCPEVQTFCAVHAKIKSNKNKGWKTLILWYKFWLISWKWLYILVLAQAALAGNFNFASVSIMTIKLNMPEILQDGLYFWNPVLFYFVPFFKSTHTFNNGNKCSSTDWYGKGNTN